MNHSILASSTITVGPQTVRDSFTRGLGAQQGRANAREGAGSGKRACFGRAGVIAGAAQALFRDCGAHEVEDPFPFEGVGDENGGENTGSGPGSSAQQERPGRRILFRAAGADQADDGPFGKVE